MRPLIIAIDGPAASGKGTLARRIAASYGLRHLDTGLTYRAVAMALMARGLPLDDEQLAVDMGAKLDLATLVPDGLTSHTVGEAASRVAVMSPVRRVLVDKQRAFGLQPPGAVLDGRDIGTVVFPDADVKFFVTATPFVRAERRYREIVGRGGTANFAVLLTEIQRRDTRDINRSDSPLRPADDAHLLDTSQMDIEAAFRTARALVDEALATRKDD